MRSAGVLFRVAGTAILMALPAVAVGQVPGKPKPLQEIADQLENEQVADEEHVGASSHEVADTDGLTEDKPAQLPEQTAAVIEENLLTDLLMHVDDSKFLSVALSTGRDVVGRWAVERDISPIDDAPTFIALNISTEAEQSWQTRDAPKPTMRIQCVDDQNMVGVSPDARLVGRDSWVDVIYRVDEAPAVETSWMLTNTREYAIIRNREQLAGFFQEIRGARKLFVQITEDDGGRYRSTYLLDGLQNLMPEISEACDVKSPKELAAEKEAELARVRTPKRIALAQRGLRREYLYRGEVDGTLTPLFRAAVLQFQLTKGLPLTGEPDDATLDALETGPHGF